MIHYAFQLARGLSFAGAEVSLVTSRGYELDGLDPPFEVVRLLRLWDPKPSGRVSTTTAARAFRKLRRVARAARYHREWLRLARWLEREQPDVVQLGDLRFAADAPWIGRLARKGFPLCDVCHNVRPFALGGPSAGTFRRSRIEHLLYRRAYRRFERVFVHYETNRRSFLRAFDVADERVVTIPHGNESLFAELRDPGSSPDRIRDDLGLDRGDRVVLLFGTLSPYKGVDVLLRAFPEVSRVEPDAVLAIAGYPLTGFDLGAARQLARKHGVADRVVFVPRYVDSREVAAWMELAEVAVFPYRSVWQSGAVAVAQTFGTPIVASRVGALEEELAGGEAGLLVPPGDPDALAAAIARVLADDDLADRLGARASEIAETRRDWSEIGARMLREYREVLR